MESLIKILSEERLEGLIAKSPKASLAYALESRRRFELGEPAILTDSMLACHYALEVIRGRWPEAEDIISKSGRASLTYALENDCRFELGEPAILTDPMLACEYALEVIQGRWPEAEDIISKSGRASYDYFAASCVGQDVSPKIHQSIERILLKQSKSGRIMSYAKYLGGNLPQSLHNRMILEGNNEYIEFIKEKESICIQYLKRLSSNQIQELLEKAQ